CRISIPTHYAYNCCRISMSYDVYWVKNRAEKIADFEHPTRWDTIYQKPTASCEAAPLWAK
ncbi:hypothetical protein, partial [uncultured Prevotella sp.]|uniref:hypothetical protein n=1 Tax=uncultured Prevotella sp. TaxID=159272 RepID=UPI0027E2EC45